MSVNKMSGWLSLVFKMTCCETKVLLLYILASFLQFTTDSVIIISGLSHHHGPGKIVHFLTFIAFVSTMHEQE